MATVHTKGKVRYTLYSSFNTCLTQFYPPEWRRPQISPNTNGGHMATKKGLKQRFSGCCSPDHSPDGLAGQQQQPEEPQKQKQSPACCWSDSSSARAKPERSHERRTRAQQAERPAFPPGSRSTCIRTLVSKLARQQSTNKTTNRKRKAKANYRGHDGAQRSLALKVD